MRPEDIGWAAGIFDGEGCVVLAKGGSTRRGRASFVQISVINTDPRILSRLRRLLGGRIDPMRGLPHHRPKWQWQMRHDPTRPALSMLLPELESKREQVDAVLAFVPNFPGTRVRDDATSPDDAEAIRLTLTYLKKHPLSVPQSRPDGVRPEDIGWAAGIIDGEGCVTLRRNMSRGSLQFQMKVHVTSTDTRILARLQALFGGRIRSNGPPAQERHLPQFGWHLLGLAVRPTLELLLPELESKREQAEVLLTFQPNAVGHRLRDGYQEGSSLVERESIWESLSALKRQDLS